MTPIQIIHGQVLIPLEYLGNATEFEFELQDGHVVVRPKLSLHSDDSESGSTWLQRVAGIAETRNPTASSHVDEILEEELGRIKLEQAGHTDVSPPSNGAEHKPNPAVQMENESDEELTLEEIYERFPWMGTAKNLEPDASVRVEEILSDEIDSRLGWKLKSPLEESA